MIIRKGAAPNKYEKTKLTQGDLINFDYIVQKRKLKSDYFALPATCILFLSIEIKDYVKKIELENKLRRF